VKPAIFHRRPRLEVDATAAGVVAMDGLILGRSRTEIQISLWKRLASNRKLGIILLRARSHPWPGACSFHNMLQKRIDDQPSISREMMREAEEMLLRHLKRVGLKHTEQRDTILRTFLETRDHLSIDELAQLVKKQDPKIGITTVYRTLKLLTECGLASEVAFHDGVARYEHQYNRRSHHHMVCTECGSSVEFFSPEVDKLEEEIGRKHHYSTTRHTFQIYGLCEDCRKKDERRQLV
jgi:Fur family ferric uptake transcriptional regulator